MKCPHCKNDFIPKIRQIFCSKNCREASWRVANPEKWKKYQDKYRSKFDVLCRWCKKPILKEERGSGIVFCSEDCRKKQRFTDNKKYYKEASKAFANYKENLGCCVCGYKRYGGSLDYHHKDPSKKRFRITAKAWFYASEETKKEIEQCVLICKNCHYELHNGNFKIVENGDVKV